MRRHLWRFAVVVAGCALAAACGGSSGSSGKSVTLGLTLSTLNNPFFVAVRQGAEQEAKKEGVALTVTDAQNDASQQANQIQNFVTQNKGAVIINPVDSDAVVPSVKAANNAKIPVIAVDRGASGGKLATFIASDNVEGGRMAARQLAQLVGSGDVVVLQGIPGTSAARDRGQGFDEAIKQYPNIHVVAGQPADFDRTKALDVMQNLLQAHPQIKGVFAQNDEMALGAIKALGARAGTSVKVVGFDGTPEGLAAVKSGQESATVAQQPKLLGQLAVQDAVKIAKGQQVAGTVKVPVKVVTQDNVAQFTAG